MQDEKYKSFDDETEYFERNTLKRDQSTFSIVNKPKYLLNIILHMNWFL